jgi:hypothetical protein
VAAGRRLAFSGFEIPTVSRQKSGRPGRPESGRGSGPERARRFRDQLRAARESGGNAIKLFSFVTDDEAQ